MFKLLSIFSLFAALAESACLQDVPELTWDVNNEATIEFGVATTSITIDGSPITLTSRLHKQAGGAYTFPSPTITVQADQIYKLNLINNLAAGTYQSGNGIKNLDFTNMHTHGAHISPESPSDYIFHAVNGQDAHQYIWRFPCDHSAGTMWYHPHIHGSTAVQVGGGAAGALIVENANEYNSFPVWYQDLFADERLLVIQHMNLPHVNNLVNDPVFSASSYIAFYAVNGQHKPEICGMEENKWIKLRLVFADIIHPETVFQFPYACTVNLLSKDGVLIHGANNQVPRTIVDRKVILTSGSRADIAISCTAGYHTVSATGVCGMGGGGMGGGMGCMMGGSCSSSSGDVFYLDVSANPLNFFTTLPAFNPVRPYYLQSLLNTAVDNTFSISICSDSVNGQPFSSQSNYLTTIQEGSVNLWAITGEADHPFHLHVNHMQVVGGSNTDWVQNGDWIDTLTDAFDAKFRAVRYGGEVTLHCHVLEHEDNGAMATIKIEGGCDAYDEDYGPVASPTCDTCTHPWYVGPPTTAPPSTPTTASPSSAPTPTTCLSYGSSCSPNSGDPCCEPRTCTWRMMNYSCR